MLDPDEIYELYWQRVDERRSTRCQCDVEFGTCPGTNQCPYADNNQGEDDENQ